MTRFVQRCQLFQEVKGSAQSSSLYMPLLVPTSPWIDITMDFITRLSRSQKGKDSILEVVDKFSKMTHFIHCKRTNDASDVVSLFFNEVVRLHGISKSITSDRNTTSLSHFWRDLWKKLDTSLQFISICHPQTDGHTEVVNRSLGTLRVVR